MRGPLSKFLLLASLATTPILGLNAQGVGKSRKAGSLEKSVRDYEARLARLEATLQQRLRDANKRSAKGDANKREARHVDEAAADQRHETTPTMARMQEEIARLQTSLAQADSENQALAKQLSAQKAAATELTTRHTQLRELHKQSETASAAAAAQAAKATTDLAQSQKQSDDLKRQLNEQHADHARLKDRYAKVSAQREEAEALVADAGEEVDAIKARNQQLTQALATQTTKAQAAARAEQEARAQVAAQAKAIDRSRVTLDEARRQVTALETRLSAERDTTPPQRDSFHARLTKAEASLSEANRLLAEHLRQASSQAGSEARRDALAERVKTLRADLATARAANARLRKSMQDQAPPPTRRPAERPPAGEGSAVHIYNQGGTVIIKQGSVQVKGGGANNAANTKGAKASGNRKRGNTKPASKSKQASDKGRRTQGSSTKRRIND